MADNAQNLFSMSLADFHDKTEGKAKDWRVCDEGGTGMCANCRNCIKWIDKKWRIK